jgi:CubicO group peptidase (beta-lactamase class C family)
MRKPFRTLLLAAVAVATVSFVPVLRAAVPTARPEEVGLSSARLARIAELVQRHIDARNVSGGVTLIARHGRVAHHEAYGLMDIDSKRPMQKDAVFRIMSMTKPVVAVSILMLIEEGKVRLTDPVSRFIPELGTLTVAQAVSTVPAQRPITVRDLLTHTSGLVSGDVSSRAMQPLGVKPGERLADVIPRLRTPPLEFQPGSQWAYSAFYGFDVLARIVEIAAGTTFDRFTRQRIFDPLGMADTSFQRAEGDARVATLYQRMDGELRKQPTPAWMNNGAYLSGGGGLFSTAADYLQFAMMLLERGEFNGARLLSPRSVEIMASAFAPDTLPGRLPGEAFGLGVRVVTNPSARNTFVSAGSFGWSGAYNTHFWVDPKEQLVGILMTQTANFPTRGEMRVDFENAVMQAIVGRSPSPATN